MAFCAQTTTSPATVMSNVAQTQIRRFRSADRGLYCRQCQCSMRANGTRPCFYRQTVNGDKVDVSIHRKSFDDLTPLYPTERIRLSTGKMDYAMRLIDLVAPIGKGQRGIIVAPPKAGKTTLLKNIANSIVTNTPEVQLIVLLIDERPEEVTDMQRSIKGDVVYSTLMKSRRTMQRSQRLYWNAPSAGGAQERRRDPAGQHHTAGAGIQPDHLADRPHPVRRVGSRGAV